MGFESFNDRQNLIMQGFAYVDVDKYVGKTMAEAIGDISTKGLKKDAKETIKYLRELMKDDDTFNHITITAVKNNNPKNDGSNSGLYAITLEDEKGNTGFSFRGTEELKLIEISQDNVDQLDNYTSAFLPTSRQNEEAVAFFDKYKKGDNYLFGHSKGGNLAQEIYSRRYDEIKKVHVLNPFPIDYFKLNEQQQKQFFSDKMNIVVTGGDFVSSLGTMPYFNRIRYARCRSEYAENFLDPHSWRAVLLNRDDINETSKTEAYAPFPVQRALMIILMNLTPAVQGTSALNAGSSIMMLYNLAVVGAIDFAEAFELIKSYSSKSMQQFLNSIKSQLEDIYHLMQNVYHSNFNQGYRYASANPEIVVDTTLLDQYARQLEIVNHSFMEIGEKIDFLYNQVGYLEALYLLKADFKIGFSHTLFQCQKYMIETSEEFNKIETEIKRG